MKITLKKLANGGLYLSGPNDQLPEGFMRRFRGVSTLAQNSIISRDGSTKLYDLDAHSITYFAGQIYSGVSTSFYRAAVPIETDLSGDDLSFAAMAPVAGGADHLFVAGGGSLFKVGQDFITTGSELITNGDMELDANWSDFGAPTVNERSSEQTYGGTYSRKFTSENDVDWEGIQQSVNVVVDHQYVITLWVYTAESSIILYFNQSGTQPVNENVAVTPSTWTQITRAFTAVATGTLEVCFISSTAAQVGTWYIDEVSLKEGYYVSQWGITPPATILTYVTGDPGNLTGDYKYQTTFYNSSTGHRSNPVQVDLGDLKLLLHLDNSVIDGVGTHTVTNNNTVTFDAGVKKFGSYSAVFNGSDQYLSVPSHSDFVFGSNDFTIHGWYRFDVVNVTQGLFGVFSDSSNFACLYVTAALGMPVKSRFVFVLYSGGNLQIQLWADYYGGLVADTWYHIALERKNNFWVVSIDGSVTGTYSSSADWPDYSSQFLIGRAGIAGSGYFYTDGFIDEFTVINGTAIFGAANFTPPTAASGIGEAITAASDEIDLSNIPVSDDDQVDQVEIWRTVANGTIYYRLTTIANGTTTYTDNTTDDYLQSIELPIDNIKPYSWFDDCYGPWNGSMFWITRTEEGERGRIYYSPIGRAEAMEGFIEVTSDSDGLQRIIGYEGNLFALSRSKAFQIYGTNPYYVHELPGVQGTNNPATVCLTPFGPIWESQDGLRIFAGGSRAPLIGYDQVKPIFRGRTVENLAAFSGIAACFARGEYIITNGSATLAFNLEKQVWRDLGIALDALTYEPSTDQILATFNEDIIDLEKEGTTQDVTTNISIDILTPTETFDPPMAIEMIRVDANANGETLALYADINDSAVSQGNLTTTAGRRYTEFDLDARLVDRLALQISGTVDAGIEIFGFDIIGWPLVLAFFIDGEKREIPGRLAGDRQSVIFEDFSDTQEPLQSVYSMDRLFYDFDTADVTMTVTLRIVNETGTESNISLGTVDTTVRTVGEININKKGRFQRLTIAGNFNTASISLRRLELACRNRRKL